MRTTTSLINALVYARGEEVAWIVSNDPGVKKADDEFYDLIENVQTFTSFETADNILSSANYKSSMEQNAAYRIGLLDGIRLAKELLELESVNGLILQSFKNPEIEKAK